MNLKKAQELKQLESRKTKIDSELNEINRSAEEIYKRQKELREKKNRVDSEIRDAQYREPCVTEHAIIRYLERVKMMDIADIADDILTESNREVIETIGSGKIKDSRGFTLIVRNYSVITIEIV